MFIVITLRGKLRVPVYMFLLFAYICKLTVVSTVSLSLKKLQVQHTAQFCINKMHKLFFENTGTNTNPPHTLADNCIFQVLSTTDLWHNCRNIKMLRQFNNIFMHDVLLLRSFLYWYTKYVV